MAEQDINRKIHLINGTTRENMSCEKTQADMKKEHEAYSDDIKNHWGSGHKCEHKGCFKDGSVECHVTVVQDIQLIEHLCPDHAYEAGYCSLCGSFWGGIESFDFNNPQKLCENCLDQLKSELGEYEIEEAEYNGVYY